MQDFIFYSQVIFHCVCVCVCISHLFNPVVCWWAVGLLHVLAIVNSVAMNIGVHVSFLISFYFLEWLFSIATVLVYSPSSMYKGSLFSTSSPILICKLKNYFYLTSTVFYTEVTHFFILFGMLTLSSSISTYFLKIRLIAQWKSGSEKPN